jgi:hypothetical protein
LERTFAKLYAMAGVEGASSHSGRRTFATRIMETTRDIDLVAQMLGHDDVEQTMIYLEPNMKSIKDALAGFYDFVEDVEQLTIDFAAPVLLEIDSCEASAEAEPARAEIKAPRKARKKPQYSYVYLLKDAGEPRFKIGKANDVRERVEALGGLNCFNFALSKCVRLRSSDAAYNLEKMLHRAFKKWRLDKIDGGAGSTEWFHIRGFDQCCDFITANVALFECSDLLSILVVGDGTGATFKLKTAKR